MAAVGGHGLAQGRGDLGREQLELPAGDSDGQSTKVSTRLGDQGELLDPLAGRPSRNPAAAGPIRPEML